MLSTTETLRQLQMFGCNWDSWPRAYDNLEQAKLSIGDPHHAVGQEVQPRSGLLEVILACLCMCVRAHLVAHSTGRKPLHDIAVCSKLLSSHGSLLRRRLGMLGYKLHRRHHHHDKSLLCLCYCYHRSLQLKGSAATRFAVFGVFRRVHVRG